MAASYYFYAYWDFRFLSLIMISTLVDFWAGARIFRVADKKAKKFYLFISLLVNLGILGFFKYCNFFIDSANLILQDAGFTVTYLDIILPMGISFYTFQSMSYSLDVYFGKLKPAKTFVDFAFYVTFFPQLVAGPIVRARQFLPQLLRPAELSSENFIKGLQIFLYGLFLKVVVADNVAPIVDPIFNNPGGYDSLAVWVAVIGYSAQIFCDFCGYSEMAIGIALSLGYVLPVNFRMPYLATDLFDFWRRWHISLSSWIRDYLYIPLGGEPKRFEADRRQCFYRHVFGRALARRPLEVCFMGNLPRRRSFDESDPGRLAGNKNALPSGLDLVQVDDDLSVRLPGLGTVPRGGFGRGGSHIRQIVFLGTGSLELGILVIRKPVFSSLHDRRSFVVSYRQTGQRLF